MEKNILFQFQSKEARPNLKGIADKYTFSVDSIDSDYGIIETDSGEGLYTVLVDAQAAKQIEEYLAHHPHHPAEAIFSNPGIEPI